MKKAVLYLCTLLPLLAGAQQSYEINGKVGKHNAPAKVFLIYKVDTTTFRDSTNIVNGEFHFKGQVPSLAVAGLFLDRRVDGVIRKLHHYDSDLRTFYLGGEKFNVTSDDSMMNAAITGSHINDSAVAAAMKQFVENVGKTITPGTMAPLFEQPDSTGKMVRLADFRGKVLLLDFWASWCMPCRAENPNLVRAWQKFKNKGFEIFSVSLDEGRARQAWLDAIKKDNMQWTNASDLYGANNGASVLYNIQTIPQNYLIDREGRILAVNLFGDALDKKLEEVFANQNK